MIHIRRSQREAPAPIRPEDRGEVFANTNSLMSIFHKKDLAKKLQNDAVFQAAEVVGIDILGHKKQSEGKTMQFNFFGSQPQAEAPAALNESSISQGFASVTEAMANNSDRKSTRLNSSH